MFMVLLMLLLFDLHYWKVIFFGKITLIVKMVIQDHRYIHHNPKSSFIIYFLVLISKRS